MGRVSTRLHTQSRSDGSEVTCKGVIWDEGKHCVHYCCLRDVRFPFIKPNSRKMSILIAKMRLRLL